MAEENKMKCKDLLEKSSFDCELITTQYEGKFSFVWDAGEISFTEAGKTRFRKILDSEARMLSNGNIELLDETITLNELEELLGAVAGYIDIGEYHELFNEAK